MIEVRIRAILGVLIFVLSCVPWSLSQKAACAAQKKRTALSDDLRTEVRVLREEVRQLRNELRDLKQLVRKEGAGERPVGQAGQPLKQTEQAVGQGESAHLSQQTSPAGQPVLQGQPPQPSLRPETSLTQEPVVQEPALKEEPTPVSPPPVTPSTQALSLNPNISVIGDFLWRTSFDQQMSPGRRIELREVELGLQSVVDPFGRADAFLSFSPEGAEVEEGYLTIFHLPWQFQGRVGKFRGNFGKINRVHPPERPFVDTPLVLKEFFGEEGLVDSGVSLSTLIPNPWDQYLEIFLEAYSGRNDRAFHPGSGKPFYVSHLKHFVDLSEASTLETGLSWAQGPNDPDGSLKSTLTGLDLTYRWKPLAAALYHSLIFQNEFLWSRRESNPLGLTAAPLHSSGYYSFLQYQLARGLFAGLRYDSTQTLLDPSLRTSGLSAVLSWFPSEFTRYQLQFGTTRHPSGQTTSDIFFHVNYTLGPHRPEPY